MPILDDNEFSIHVCEGTVSSEECFQALGMLETLENGKSPQKRRNSCSMK